MLVFLSEVSLHTKSNTSFPLPLPFSPSFSSSIHLFHSSSLSSVLVLALGKTIKSFRGLSHPMSRVMRICLYNHKSRILHLYLQPFSLLLPSSFHALFVFFCYGLFTQQHLSSLCLSTILFFSVHACLLRNFSITVLMLKVKFICKLHIVPPHILSTFLLFLLSLFFPLPSHLLIAHFMLRLFLIISPQKMTYIIYFPLFSFTIYSFSWLKHFFLLRSTSLFE